MKISESVKILKALSDSSRLLIVNALFEKPQYVEELSERFQLANSTVSFHLKKLEAAQLVYHAKEQYYTIYYVKKDIFDLNLKSLIYFRDSQKSIQNERIEKYREKVLSIFMTDGKIIRFPTQHKKRWIIFEEIFKEFDSDKFYSEKEVNAIIEQYSEDYCTIRREMIDKGVMIREKGLYQIKKEKISLETILSDKEQHMAQGEQTETGDKNNKKTRRKQLKAHYKEADIRKGVYFIENIKTNNKIIGSSVDVHAMLNRCRFELEIGKSKNRELQNDWNLYGADSFKFKVLEYLDSEKIKPGTEKQALKTLSNKWIKKLG